MKHPLTYSWRKKLSALLLAASTVSLLSACAVTTEERVACETKEGLIVIRPFKMHAKEATQSFTFCEVNGKITKVFDTDNIPAPKDFSSKCNEASGAVYTRETKVETREKNDKGEAVLVVKERIQSFICVAEGEVTSSLVKKL